MVKKMRENCKCNKGFTLIELIVVIAVIGILIAVAVPKLSGFTDSAKDSNDNQLGKMIVTNTSLLIAEGKIIPPVADTATFTAKNLTAPDADGYNLVFSDPTGVTFPSGGVTSLNTLLKPFIEKKTTISKVNRMIEFTITAGGDISYELKPTT